MYRLALIAIFIGGTFYLYNRNSAKEQALAPLPPPPPPPALEHAPPQVLTQIEIEKIRLATKDGDPQVRWAAIDLLHRVRDPQAQDILQKALKIDSESSVRRKSLDILKNVESPDRLEVLIGALTDTEREIRVAALVALGDIGDPKSTPAIVRALRDTDPIVRRQALSTLGVIQTKQDLQHKQLQDKILLQHKKAMEEYEKKVNNRAAAQDKPMKDLLDKNKVE